MYNDKYKAYIISYLSSISFLSRAYSLDGLDGEFKEVVETDGISRDAIMGVQTLFRIASRRLKPQGSHLFLS